MSLQVMNTTSQERLNLKLPQRGKLEYQNKDTWGIYTYMPVSRRKPSVKKYKSNQCCILCKLTKCTLYTNMKHKLKVGQQQNILNIEFAHIFVK